MAAAAAVLFAASITAESLRDRGAKRKFGHRHQRTAHRKRVQVPHVKINREASPGYLTRSADSYLSSEPYSSDRSSVTTQRLTRFAFKRYSSVSTEKLSGHDHPQPEWIKQDDFPSRLPRFGGIWDCYGDGDFEAEMVAEARRARSLRPDDRALVIIE